MDSKQAAWEHFARADWAAARDAFAAALEAEPGEATMVGDDVDSDVGGAKRVGMRGVLVRTGKFREESLAAADAGPDGVIDSVAELPDFLAAR